MCIAVIIACGSGRGSKLGCLLSLRIIVGRCARLHSKRDYRGSHVLLADKAILVRKQSANLILLSMAELSRCLM